MPAQDSKYSVPSSWGATPYQDLDLPSGHTILVKRLDLQAIVAADMIDDFDKLSPTVEEKIVQPSKGKRPSDRAKKKPTKAQQKAAEEQAMKDFFTGDNIAMLMTLMGRIIPQVVIQPKVACHLVKNEKGSWVEMDPDEREEGLIYVDSIPLGDQMAILQFGMEGMEMESLQSFSKQSQSDVVDVEAVPVRQDPPL